MSDLHPENPPTAQPKSPGYSPSGSLTQVPGARIALPTPKSEEMVAVRRSEIESLKRGVRRAFENPVEYASTWSGVWLGVAVSALFSLIALLAVKDNTVNDYIISGHVACVLGAGFLSGYLAYLHRKNHSKTEAGHEDVIKDLDELLRRAPTQIDDDGEISG